MAERNVPPATREWLRGARVALGAALILLGVLPVYRLLDPVVTGIAGEVTAFFGDIHFAYLWTGMFMLLPVALLGARFLPDGFETFLRRIGAQAARVSNVRFAIMLSLFAAVLTAAIALVVLDGRPAMLDSLAQLLHARYWSEGRIAGPLSDGGGFRAIQNSIFTGRGWVSQYPPGHVLVLTAFLLLGVPWLSGPFLVAVTVFFTTLTAARLLPDRPATARFASSILAVSPFFLSVAASYMNHATTAACLALAAYALVRAWQDNARWAVVAGAACGFSLMTRPLSTIGMSVALAAFIPFTSVARVTAARFVRINTLAIVAALPFLGALLIYNNYFFGSPATFGYDVALGPRMALGFHQDPFGNLYGFREAVAYTSSDIMSLGINLLESPLSSVLVTGVFFISARRLTAGERVIAAWALAPVITNFFYWHHGLFMGPRMLHESAPGWALLFGISTVSVIDRIPRDLAWAGFRPRAGVTAVTVVALALSLLFLAPERVLSYGRAIQTPVPAVDGPSLVFVHDGWTGRLLMTLASEGYRLDLIETLYRQNPTCSLVPLVDAVRTGDDAQERAVLAALDTVPRASRLPPILETAPGNRIRVRTGETLSASCMAQVNSDSTGILDIAPLLWLTDLPGGGNAALVARDLGPGRNSALLAQHPDRTPLVYMLPSRATEVPVLVPYEEGMRRLWGGVKP